MKTNIEISTTKLIISFSLIFILGILFAVLNGYYVKETGVVLPSIVYGISFISLIVGASIILLFQWKIIKLQLKKLLTILPDDEKEIINCLLDNENKIEQNYLVAYTKYNKVRISRILEKYKQKGLIEKKKLGNTNLIILKLK
jgi:uncharacterized membrane protein